MKKTAKKTHKKTYSQLCQAKDDARRKGTGWGSMAFMSPKFPRGRTKREREAVEFVLAREPQTVSLHIYDVIQLVHDAMKLKEQP